MKIFFDKNKLTVKVLDEEYLPGTPIKQAREYQPDKIAVNDINNYSICLINRKAKMITTIIELNDLTSFKRIGHEFWDKRFIVLRDSSHISVLDLNSFIVSKIVEVESENSTIEVDMIQKKVVIYTSQKVDGEIKIKKVELKQDLFEGLAQIEENKK